MVIMCEFGEVSGPVYRLGSAVADDFDEEKVGVGGGAFAHGGYLTWGAAEEDLTSGGEVGEGLVVGGCDVAEYVFAASEGFEVVYAVNATVDYTPVFVEGGAVYYSSMADDVFGKYSEDAAG